MRFSPPIFLNAQSQKQETSTTEVVSESPVIHVSEEMFSGIENWLALEHEEIPLDQFLLSKGMPEAEVELIKKQHLAGLKSQSNTTKYKSGGGQLQQGCACNAIMPTSLTQRWHSSPYQPFDRGYDPGSLGSFEATERSWRNDGLATDFYIRAESNNRFAIRNTTQNGAASMKIINLCSNVAFLRDDLCNCDKFIEYDGEFRNHIDTKIDAKINTLFPSRSRVAFHSAYMVYKSEKGNPIGLNPVKAEIIDTASWKVSGHRQWSIDWSKVADAHVALMDVAINVLDTNFDDAISSYSDFYDNLDSVIQVDFQNGTFNNSYVRPFTGWDTLKANMPMYFYGVHAYSGVVETSGRERNNSQINYHSIFYWAFNIASSQQGYDIGGEPMGNYTNCCNEDLAVWDLHNSLVNNDLNGAVEDMAVNMQDAINFSALSGYFDFQNTSKGPSILDNGFVNIRDNQSIYRESNKGQAYTLDKCGCETFLTDREYPDGSVVLDFLKPQVNIQPQKLCPGETPVLYINNADEINLSGGCDQIEIVVSLSGQGQVFSTFASGSNVNINLSLAGTYTISFIDRCTGCQVSSQMVLEECKPKSDSALDCLWDHLNLFPSPVPKNNEEININACLLECTDDPTDTTGIAAHHSQFFPATLEIRDLQGNLVFGPQTNVLPSSSYNWQTNCYEQIIDLTQQPTTIPFPSGMYAVIVNFANGNSKSRLIRLQ